MSPDPEEIQHESVDREKPLRVYGGFEPAHLLLALSRRLMRNLCAVVRIRPRAVNHGWHHGAVRRGVATQRVGDQTARCPTLSCQYLAKEPRGRPAVTP